MTVPTNDHWTLDIEALGMERAGDELVDLILRCRPPFAVCVQGKWGSGKTSLMRYAMARLGGKPLGTTMRTSDKPNIELPPSLNAKWERHGQEASKRVFESLKNQIHTPPTPVLEEEVRVASIWFNPWQHQGAAMPMAALLHELRAQLTFGQKIFDRSKKLAQVSIEAGITILGELIDAVSTIQGTHVKPGSILGKIRGLGETAEARNFETVSDAQRFNLLFEQAIARLLCVDIQQEEDERWRDASGREVPPKRLVIFIDDLDRCSEAQVLSLLEAIKLYLQTRYCVFVLGVDAAAAKRAVAKTLPGSSREHAQEYLEKLFQATIQVPVTSETTTFLNMIAKDARLPSCTALLAEILEPNPRKMKNFVNGLAVAWNCASTEVKKLGIEAFVLVHYLKTNHAEVYRLLTYDPKHIAILCEVLAEAGQVTPKQDPVRLLFRRSFRHTQDVVGELKRTDVDTIVDELIERIDRHKGDTAFVQRWNGLTEHTPREELVERLRPILVVTPPEPRLKKKSEV